VPPFIGLAVRATGVPLQTLTVDGVILTEAINEEVIVTIEPLLIAVGVVTHNELLVISTVTTSLLFNVDDVKLLPVDATFTPFTFH
jgi:hypothetical protein